MRTYFQNGYIKIENALPCFFAYMGIGYDLVFSNLGAAYGTAKVV